MKNIAEQLNVQICEEEISYPILIGNSLISELGGIISRHYQGDKILLVSDQNVDRIYVDRVVSGLKDKGFEVYRYIIPAGEKAKSSQYLQGGYDLLVENNFQRDNLVIALGGGVPGDLAGYLAASYMRGISLVQIPTTLLAQVDSSVGGKTAINHPGGKNLIGAFYQPELVIIDTNFLQTLPFRELKTGIAEVIKYGFIVDKDFFEYLFQNKKDIYDLNLESIIHIVKKSCSIKSDIVNKDQKEQGKRALLNFGHTIGHALEAVTDYNKYNHGEAVAVGMLGASMISSRLGYFENGELKLVEEILRLYELPFCHQIDNVDIIYNVMRHDKKARNNTLRWVLLKEIGRAFLKENIEQGLIKKVLEELKC